MFTEYLHSGRVKSFSEILGAFIDSCKYCSHFVYTLLPLKPYLHLNAMLSSFK